MKLTEQDLDELAARAVAAAQRAGRWIATQRPTTVSKKPGMASPASAVVTDVDRRAEAMLLDDLHDTLERFDLGLLSEERPDDGSRLVKDHFWSIDPLDGTLPFTEDRFGYAVSVALVRRDGVPLVGVVHEPRSDRLLRAVRGGGADTPALDVDRTPDELTLYCDRSLPRDPRFPALRTALETLADAEGLRAVTPVSGAGGVLNACQVLANPPACYLKFPTDPPGGGSLWDFAASSCLLNEAGAFATDYRGRALDLNREDSTFMNHRGLFVCSSPALADAIQRSLDRARLL